MGIVCVQSQTAGAASKIAALQVHLGATGVDSASLSAKLPRLTGSVGLAQRGTAALASQLPGLTVHLGGSQRLTAFAHGTLGSLRASLQVESANHNSVAVVTTLAALRAAGAVSATGTAHGTSRLPFTASSATSATQHTTASSRLGALASSLQVQAANLNHVAVVTSLAALRGSLTGTASSSAHMSARLPLVPHGTTTATQSLHAASALTLASAVQAVAVQRLARLTATLGPLTARATSQPPPAGYVADGNYYVALPARPFYATLQARPFYSALPARSFYILSNPDMTPLFDTLDPRETLVLTLDASADLASGETLTSITAMTALQQSGTPGALPTLTGQVINAQPVTLIVGGKSVTIAANCGVQVIATGGVSGCRYLIAATCNTSNPDKVLTLKGVLPVSAS